MRRRCTALSCFRTVGLSCKPPFPCRPPAVEFALHLASDPLCRAIDGRDNFGVRGLSKDLARRNQTYVDPATLVYSASGPVQVIQGDGHPADPASEPPKCEPQTPFNVITNLRSRLAVPYTKLESHAILFPRRGLTARHSYSIRCWRVIDI